MITCSHSQDTQPYVKTGYTHIRSRRFRRQSRRRQYAPGPKPLGYNDVSLS